MLAGAATAAKRTVLRANGSTLVKPGYISVYQEGMDDVGAGRLGSRAAADEGGRPGQAAGVVPTQHFTEPPPRFSEASLVKALEEYGIGRPSTYASIISTLRDRQYVDIESRRFTATDIGKIVSRFLTQYFTTYVDYDFTAKMEDSLDAVANGEQEWVPLLEKFWKPFIDLVNHTETSVSREEVAQARDLGKDPVSGKPMSVRMGRFGPFVQIGTKDDADKPRFAGLRPGPEDGRHHARPRRWSCSSCRASSAPTAAGEEITDQRRPLRPLCEIRRQVRFAQDRRSLRNHPRARAGGHPREGNRGCQPADPGFSRRRHSSAERPLRPVHHRQGAQRENPEGQGAEEPDLGGVPGAAGGGAGAHLRQVGPQGAKGRQNGKAKPKGSGKAASGSGRADAGERRGALQSAARPKRLRSQGRQEAAAGREARAAPASAAAKRGGQGRQRHRRKKT